MYVVIAPNYAPNYKKKRKSFISNFETGETAEQSTAQGQRLLEEGRRHQEEFGGAKRGHRGIKAGYKRLIRNVRPVEFFSDILESLGESIVHGVGDAMTGEAKQRQAEGEFSRLQEGDRLKALRRARELSQAQEDANRRRLASGRSILDRRDPDKRRLASIIASGEPLAGASTSPTPLGNRNALLGNRRSVISPGQGEQLLG